MKKTLMPLCFLLFIIEAFSQNVGIGTSSPGEKLEVSGNIKAGSPTANGLIGTHPTYDNTYAAFWKDTYDYSLMTNGLSTFLNAPSSSGAIYLRTANSDRVIISGGLNTPHLEVTGAGSQKLRITSTNGTSAALEFALTGGRSWQILTGPIMTFDYAADLSTTVSHTIDISPATVSLEPYSDNQYGLGNSLYRWTQVYATTGVIQTSDERLKKNITDVHYGINTLMKMRPVSYQWKDGSKGGRTALGFLAQDMMNVIPEVVYHDIPAKTDLKKDAKANIENAYGMNYAELIPVLVKSIQEQQQMIIELKKQIEELKRK